jgi:hypothetical protein
VLADVRTGRLVTALDDHLGEFAPLHMLSTHRLMLSPTANTLRTFLQDASAPISTSLRLRECCR